ncbi:queuosine precursor transporter [Aquibacillus sp. 3ASR75-11]|uniref:Probable queuosine precursor transporter n=1 Tax=Terrihalobacillus insolitus TaxID=2950438 RepID=A0A9X3WTA3_9BACI|nr:queuosine precursor transporter [Terrihalobacillus insolitus]MDC3424453.1 queuosine precursor transporter [Terrihalobacillus insolitus]
MFVYLNALFVGLLIVSNILGVKLFSIGSYVLPAAVIVYVITYLITDVIGEVYGKKAAQQTVQAGFVTQIVVMAFIVIAINLPAAPFFASQEAFKTILGGSFRVMLASLISYFVSQNLDVFLFHRLKQMHGEKKLWVRNNLSTMSSQLIDTTIFISIAFYGTLPTTALLGMIVTQYAFKFIVAVVDTPIVYLLVNLSKRQSKHSDLVSVEK